MTRLLQDIKQQLLAEKKNLGLIIVMAVFGLLLWGRLLLKDIPRTASAQPGAEIVSQSSDNQPVSLSPGDRSEVIVIDPTRRLDRDIFAFNPNRYRRTFLAEESDNLLEQDNYDRELSDKNLGATEVLERARRLELKSVVTGWRPRAVINGYLVKPGGLVEGFMLQEVAGRYVLLELNGIVIRLWM